MKWAGGLLTLVTAAVMGAYFAEVGLDKADKLASVIGAFIAFAGIVLAVYGTVTAGPGRSAGPGKEPGAPSDTGNVHNEILKSPISGSKIVQAGRYDVQGPQSAPDSPDEPGTTQER